MRVLRTLLLATSAFAGATGLCAQDVALEAGDPLADRPARTPLERTIEAELPSLVKVHGASGLSTIQPYASGVLVSAAGHVLTLDLVMLQPGQTRVVLDDGSVHEATLLPADAKLGVRMLKIDPGERVLRPLRCPADDVPLRPGTLVVSIGNAFRLAEYAEKMSATFGVLVARTRTGLRYRLSEVDHEGELLITDAPNNPGHYGGGLFTLRGDWIGLNARMVESVETNTQISAAIPTRELRAYIARHVDGPAEMASAPAPEVAGPPPYHGIVLFDRGLRRSPPAYVERVLRESPAAAIGLRPDDLIVRFGDVPIRTCAEFHDAVTDRVAGDEVSLVWKRGSRVLQATLVLAEGR